MAVKAKKAKKRRVIKKRQNIAPVVADAKIAAEIPGDTFQVCVLDALKFPAAKLNQPLKNVWSYNIDAPMDHIDDACRAHDPPCYQWTRAQVHKKCQKLNGNNSLADFIKALR
jgi:hypothetical protein